MNLKDLPNYPVLRHLYEQYHADGETGRPRDSIHLSSHWNIYSQATRVAIDSAGNLLGFEGAGFGNYRDERLLKRLADYLCCSIHWCRAENKQELFNLIGVAQTLVKKVHIGHHYLSYDLFRQVHALATIKRYFRPSSDEKFTILVIGDRFGFPTALIKAIYSSASLVLVDIGRTLFFQCLYLQVMYPKQIHAVVGCDVEDRSPALDADFLYCPTDRLEDLQDYRHCLAINVCSMQEMNRAEIERHFRYLRAHAEPGALFYCCNRECKVLPDGERIEFIRYPWLPTDRHLVDGYPSVYSFWFSARRIGNGPKWLGLKIPLIDGPDGPVRHHLTRLSGVTESS